MYDTVIPMHMPVPQNPYGQVPPNTQFQQPMMPLISMDEAIWGYLRFKESKRKDKKTIDDIELSLRTLSFIRPDIQYLNQITKRLIFEYEGLVAELPANFRKSSKLRNLRFDQLKHVARDKPKLSPASIDKYTLTLRSFINWCQETDRMPPWKLPRFHGRDQRNNKDKRHPFTAEELQKFFQSPQFTGHAPEVGNRAKQHIPGNELVKNHMYWVPWVALYTGMRLREIIQLYVSDVRQEHGVFYFDINEDDKNKSLKNHASRRKVPVHPKLISLGFLDYVKETHKAGHKRVFYDARPTAAGAPADLYSKHFGRYLIRIGIKHDRLSFHSFRHTFIDQAARQARLPDHMIKALVGHADHTITFGTYGGRLSVAELAKAQANINFEIQQHD